MSTAGKQNREKKDPTLNARASKRNANATHCKQGKGSQRRSKLTIANPDAAAVDVGSQVHYAAVPEGRAEQSVRSFGAYTAQLDELVQWFKDCEIKTVAMESTGVYWIPLYQKLEEAGFEVLLVDARQVKHVPGRTIPGLNVLAVLSLISEIGTNMAKWRNAKAFVSWMGLSPNNKVSGERVLSSRTRKVNNRAATTLTKAGGIVPLFYRAPGELL